MKSRIQKQAQKGFTLIELMIVVAIIGILASVALPAYQSYTLKSAANACLAEAKAHMSLVVAARAASETFTAHTAGACEANADIATSGSEEFQSARTGTSKTSCDVGTGSCQLSGTRS